LAAGRGSNIAGIKAVRRLLKQLPDEARQEIAEVLERGGRRILTAQKAAAPRKTGQLAAGLRMDLSKKSLLLRIGIFGKASARRLFYARIIGGGRRAQTVTVSRRGKAAIAAHGKRLQGRRKVQGDIVSTYRLRVKARVAQPVIDPSAARQARRALYEDMKAVWGRVLAKHPPGSGDGD
jgi:hypothetical protein